MHPSPPDSLQLLSVMSDLELSGDACGQQTSRDAFTPGRQCVGSSALSRDTGPEEGRQMTSNGLTATLRECCRMPATVPETLPIHFNLTITCQERHSCFPHLTEETKVQRGSPLRGDRVTGQILCCMCIEGQSRQYGRCHRSCLQRVLPEGPHPSWRSEPLIG